MTASIDKLKTTPEQNTEFANHFAEVFPTGKSTTGVFIGSVIFSMNSGRNSI